MNDEGTFQGSSVYTERKEFNLQGVSNMRFHQFKSLTFKYPHVICADIFSGTGTNVVGDEIVDGSPIRIIDAAMSANNTKRVFHYFFSDIRKSACDTLKNVIRVKYPWLCDVEPQYMSAKDAVNVLGGYLRKHSHVFLYLVIDPNGPKDFPKTEVEDLLREFPRRIDVVPYISANAINRCIGARNKAGMQFKSEWLNGIENFDSGFVQSMIAGNRVGWIREPIKGDASRWTILPTFGCMKPNHDWNKQGFVDLKSARGIQAVKFYCGGF